MIGRLIDLCARNKLLVLIATLMFTGLGIWSVINTPLDALPDLSDTQVIVYTPFPGQALVTARDLRRRQLRTKALHHDLVLLLGRP